MRSLILGVAVALFSAGAALAGPVTLKANPVDSDGRVTLGDLFDGAGPASNVVVGNRAGPSIVFEAGQLQSLARQAGLELAAVADAPPSAATVRPAPARAAYADRIISRNDMVEVAYEVGGVRLTISGRAEGNAAAGQRLAVRNLQSGRTIDAVAVAPGQAMAGSAAQEARVSQQLAAR